MQPSRSNVILQGFALKNLPPSESTIATVTNRTVEIPHTRPQVSVRNDIIVILNAAWAEWRISNKLQKIPHIHSEWQADKKARDSSHTLGMTRLSFWTECSGVKNLPRNEFIVRSLTYVRDDKQCHSDDRKGGRISYQESTSKVKNLLDRSIEGEMLHYCSACFRDLLHAFEMTTMSFWRP